MAENTKSDNQEKDKPDPYATAPTAASAGQGTIQDPEKVKVEDASNSGDPAIPSEPVNGQTGPDDDGKKRSKSKKGKERTFEVPKTVSSEHFYVESEINQSGVVIVRIAKPGNIGGEFEIAASQLAELEDLLGQL